MKRMIRIIGICLVVLLAGFMTGCESDDSPDDITFLNLSDYKVTVTVRSTISNVDYRFILERNGGETKYVKTLIAPLSYSYKPSSVVTDRYDGDLVVFENRY